MDFISMRLNKCKLAKLIQGWDMPQLQLELALNSPTLVIEFMVVILSILSNDVVSLKLIKLE